MNFIQLQLVHLRNQAYSIKSYGTLAVPSSQVKSLLQTIQSCWLTTPVSDQWAKDFTSRGKDPCLDLWAKDFTSNRGKDLSSK